MTRLGSKLKECELKLQHTQIFLRECKIELREERERNKMSVEESRMRLSLTEALRRQHENQIERLTSHHHECICECEKKRIYEEEKHKMMIERAINILRQIQHDALIDNVATRIHRDAAKAKIQEDDMKLSARLFRAIACDDAHTIDFLSKQAHVFPGRLLSLRNRANETPIEFASRRRRARALRSLKQLETLERERLSLPQCTKTECEKASEGHENRLDIDREMNDVSVVPKNIEFDGSKVLCTCCLLRIYSIFMSNQIISITGTHLADEKKEESSTKRRLRDARRIAKNLENDHSRESRMIRDVVVHISTRMKSDLHRFERECLGSLLSFSNRLEASEHLVASYVENISMSDNIRRPVTIRGDNKNIDDDNKDNDDNDVIENLEEKEEEKKKKKDKEEKKKNTIIRFDAPTISGEEKSRTKSEIEAELFALRMCRRFKDASIRMARAKRDSRKIYANLQCRIKGLENELRIREEALQVAGLATRNLWNRLMSTSPVSTRSVDVVSICSSHHRSIGDLYDSIENREGDFDLFMQLLLRHGPTKRVWNILTRKRGAGDALRPGSA